MYIIQTYRIGTWLPTRWAHLSMGIRVLEGLNQSNSLIYRSSHWQIVHGDLAQHSGLIDDKETAQGMSTGLQIDSVVLADLVRQIGEQWNLDVAQTALLARRVDPSQMGEVRVHTDPNHFRFDLLELGNAIGEGYDLCGADKGAETEKRNVST